MEAVLKDSLQSRVLDLSQISSLPRVDTAISVTVTRVLGGLVLVSCEEKRVGVFDLEDTRNKGLLARSIKVGDTLEAFILSEDNSGNLLLSVKSPQREDRWLQLHRTGTEIDGHVEKKTQDFILVRFPRSTTGRIKKTNLAPGIDFDRLAAHLQIGEPIKCKILAVYSRGGKKLHLTLAESTGS